MPKYSEPFGFEYHTQRLRGQLEEIQDDLLGASSSSGAPSALAVAPPTASAPSAEGTAAEGAAASAEGAAASPEGAAASSTAAPSALSKSKGKSRARDDTTKPTRNKKSRGVDPVAVRAAEPESYYEVSRAVHFLAVSTGTGRASYDAAAVAYNTEYLSGALFDHCGGDKLRAPTCARLIKACITKRAKVNSQLESQAQVPVFLMSGHPVSLLSLFFSQAPLNPSSPGRSSTFLPSSSSSSSSSATAPAARRPSPHPDPAPNPPALRAVPPHQGLAVGQKRKASAQQNAAARSREENLSKQARAMIRGEKAPLTRAGIPGVPLSKMSGYLLREYLEAMRDSDLVASRTAHLQSEIWKQQSRDGKAGACLV